MRKPRVALPASMLLCVFSVTSGAAMLACSGDDDDDTYGIDGGNYVYDATTASDGGDGGDAAVDTGIVTPVDSGFDANSLTCVGGGGSCQASSAACASSGGSLVGTPVADNGCVAAAGTGSVCCTMVCGASPGNVCMSGLFSGPPYCQNGEFVCPNGTVVDAGAKDSGALDASDGGD